MKRIEMRVTRMAMVALCSAALAAPTYLLAQDNSAAPAPPTPPAASAPQDQGPGGPGGRPRLSPEERDQHQLTMMTKHYNLTADQQASIKKILADNTAKMEAMHQDQTAGKDKHAQMHQLMQDRSTAVRAVLTADQQKQYDTDMAAMQQRREEHEHGGHGGWGGPGVPGGPDGDKGGNTPPPPPPPPQQ